MEKHFSKEKKEIPKEEIAYILTHAAKVPAERLRQASLDGNEREARRAIRAGARNYHDTVIATVCRGSSLRIVERVRPLRRELERSFSRALELVAHYNRTLHSWLLEWGKTREIKGIHRLPTPLTRPEIERELKQGRTLHVLETLAKTHQFCEFDRVFLSERIYSVPLALAVLFELVTRLPGSIPIMRILNRYRANRAAGYAFPLVDADYTNLGSLDLKDLVAHIDRVWFRDDVSGLTFEEPGAVRILLRVFHKLQASSQWCILHHLFRNGNMDMIAALHNSCGISWNMVVHRILGYGNPLDWSSSLRMIQRFLFVDTFRTVRNVYCELDPVELKEFALMHVSSALFTLPELRFWILPLWTSALGPVTILLPELVRLVLDYV